MKWNGAHRRPLMVVEGSCEVGTVVVFGQRRRRTGCSSSGEFPVDGGVWPSGRRGAGNSQAARGRGRRHSGSVMPRRKRGRQRCRLPLTMQRCFDVATSVLGGSATFIDGQGLSSQAQRRWRSSDREKVTEVGKEVAGSHRTGGRSPAAVAVHAGDDGGMPSRAVARLRELTGFREKMNGGGGGAGPRRMREVEGVVVRGKHRGGSDVDALVGGGWLRRWRRTLAVRNSSEDGEGG